MFEKLAKFRPFEPRRMTPPPFLATHCNDNLPGFRRPEGRRPRPNPAPTCHWSLIDGRLECRWTVDGSEAATSDPDRQRRAGQRSIAMRQAVSTTACA
ncbi:hypothetical protein ACFFWD_08650 [Bradyrhizobium erythrophlei]|uniref:hypothetical protein n=1 Tax=Bradyrhizobium erythrophlei TaxID=1437360 RepID=UPI0035E63EE1